MQKSRSDPPRRVNRRSANAAVTPQKAARDLTARRADVGWRLPLIVSGALALLALGVYLRTLARSVPAGDSGEMITVAWVLGVAHPSGYPLFTMLGHLFTFLPFGSPAFRVNLMSAVFHAAAAAATAVLIYRLIAVDSDDPAVEDGRPWTVAAGSAIGGLALAFSAAFWSYALVAEVFAINSFFGALILLVLLEWERRPERTRLLLAFGFLSGLAATDHQTIIFIAPGCLVLLISGARKLTSGRAAISMRPAELGRQLGFTAALLFVGLLGYLYLPLAASADPPLNWGNPRTVNALFRQILRSDYGTFHLTVASQPVYGSSIQHVGLLLGNLYRGFTLPGCLLIVPGLWWLWQHGRVPGLAVVLAFLSTGPGFVAFANPEITGPVLYGVLERFYILPSVYVAIVIGVGGYQVASWIGGRVQAGQRPMAAVAAGLALLAIPLSTIAVHFNRLDQSENLFIDHFNRDLLAPIEQSALLVTQGDVITMGVDYLQLVEGVRPDVISLDIEKLKMADYVQLQRRRQPGLVIPFESYVPGGDQMARLVDANLRSRPVYMFAVPKDPGFMEHFDTPQAGLALRMMPRNSARDRFALVAARLEFFKQMHFPTRSFSETTYESKLVHDYGRLAFSIGYVLDDGVRNAEAAEYYRLAVKLDPEGPGAYLNLGLVLSRMGRPSSEVAPLWEEFVRLSPSAPEAPAIRERLRIMGRSR